jgi:hypothetical protein
MTSLSTGLSPRLCGRVPFGSAHPRRAVLRQFCFLKPRRNPSTGLLLLPSDPRCYALIRVWYGRARHAYYRNDDGSPARLLAGLLRDRQSTRPSGVGTVWLSGVATRHTIAFVRRSELRVCLSAGSTIPPDIPPSAEPLIVLVHSPRFVRSPGLILFCGSRVTAADA